MAVRGVSRIPFSISGGRNLSHNARIAEKKKTGKLCVRLLHGWNWYDLTNLCWKARSVCRRQDASCSVGTPILVWKHVGVNEFLAVVNRWSLFFVCQLHSNWILDETHLFWNTFAAFVWRKCSRIHFFGIKLCFLVPTRGLRRANCFG